MFRRLFLFFGVAVLSGCTSVTFFTTRDNVQIVYEYDTVEHPRGTVILLHGLGSSLDEWYGFRKQLARDNWSALALDLRGHGQSTAWGKEVLDWHQFSREGFKTSVRDVETAVEFLKDEKNLWIAGSSFGANLALVHAVKDPRIKGIVLLSPGLNYAGVVTQDVAADYDGRPLLIAAAHDDPGAPEVAEYLYEKASADARLLIYDEGGHGSAMIDNVDELGGEILKWMDQHTAKAGPADTSGSSSG